MSEVTGRIVLSTITCPAGAIRTTTYGVDATAMLFQRRGWDIHALSAEPGRGRAGAGPGRRGRGNVTGRR